MRSYVVVQVVDGINMCDLLRFFGSLVVIFICEVEMVLTWPLNTMFMRRMLSWIHPACFLLYLKAPSNVQIANVSKGM